MTKREQYNLIFYRKTNSDGTTKRIIASEPNYSGPNSWLTFINALSHDEIQDIVDTITTIHNGGVYDPDFMLSDGTEAFTIVFNSPNFIIEGVLTINMLDLQALLQEWLTFTGS